MPTSVSLPADFSGEELRRLAKKAKAISQGRRLLSLATFLDGMSRGDAARSGGMDRQTLRDWVHRFNATGPAGLLANWSKGPAPRLSVVQKAKVAAIVETGPDREVDGVVSWRRVDLKRVIKERFGVECHERYVGTLLKELSFSHISVRPRHPARDGEIVAAYKTYGPPGLQAVLSRAPFDQSATNGENSSLNRERSHQSECGNGRKSFILNSLW
jgi:transposase